MNPFIEMMRRVQSSYHYDQMLKFCKPLSHHFGVTHFWSYRISRSGVYSYVGTHAAWNEYCFDQSLLKAFPCIRHPSILRRGVTLMKAGADGEYKQLLQTAWDKFQINFNLNIFDNHADGIEAFGFATRFQDQEAEERLINELPLLRYFIKEFRQKHGKLFSLMDDNSVDLSANIGTIFYERSKSIIVPFERSRFLREIGCSSVFQLTRREKDILKLLANGFPASYIKDQLHLGLRTVENYTASIKEKLNCQSKVELIKKAQEISLTGFFDE